MNAAKPKAKASLRVMLRTLNSRNYRLFFGGQSVSLIGTWMQLIAMHWLVYRLTNSPLLLGLVSFSGRVPIFLLTPVAGVLADRWDRRRILVITQSLSATLALVLAWLVYSGQVQVWHLIGLSLVLGLVNAMDIPSRQAFVVDIIENKADVGNAIALNSMIINGARLIGPSVAGILIAAAGESVCFMINGVSYLAVIAALLAMKIDPDRRTAAKTRVFRELKEGARYVFGFAPMRSILILVGVASLMAMPYSILMPVYAKDIFGGGANVLGFLMAASGAGALIGGLYLASRENVLGLDRMIVFSAAIFGGAILAFAYSRSLWLSLPLMVISGFGMMIQLASSNTVLQTIVEDDMRGRLMSFYTMSFMGVAPFGSLLGGALASRIGAPATLAIGGASLILGAAWFSTRIKGIRLLLKPIYQQKGILPQVAAGLSQAADSGRAPYHDNHP